MKRILDHAIILRRVNYGETDRVLTVLGQTSGKISIFAKGVRKPKSRLSGGIELLSESEIGYIDGKSELKTLTGASLINHYENIVKSMEKTTQAFEALKKIEKLSDDNAGQEYYEILKTYLTFLADEEFNSQVVEAWFNLQTLKKSGSLGEIQVEQDKATVHYSFDYDNQVFRPTTAHGYGENDIKLIALLSRSVKPVRLVNASIDILGILSLTKNLSSQHLAV